MVLHPMIYFCYWFPKKSSGIHSSKQGPNCRAPKGRRAANESESLILKPQACGKPHVSEMGLLLPPLAVFSLHAVVVAASSPSPQVEADSVRGVTA